MNILTVNSLNKALETIGSSLRVEYVITHKNNKDIGGFNVYDSKIDHQTIRPVIPCMLLDMNGIPEKQAETVVRFYNDAMKNNNFIPEASNITREYVLDNVKPYVVSEKNEEMFVAADYMITHFWDMLICYYVTLPYIDGINASFMLTNKLLQTLDISCSEIRISAKANLDYKISSLNDVLAGFGHPQIEFVPMYVLTNPEEYRGAAVIVLPEVISLLHEMFGEKFIILPSSVHEVIVLPYEFFKKNLELSEMVAEVNASMIEPGDRLTDHAYIVEDKTFSVIQ